MRSNPGTQTWPRPRPVVGDRSSSSERAADPSGWALSEDIGAALAEVIAARRDIRRFRPDTVDDTLVQQVLTAGHAAPSVGHSQPWRFIVVRDAATRTTAAAMADRARLAQADQMDAARGSHLRSLQLDGLREAPVGIIVCCDRRVRPAGVLGRATYADTDLWSCACAIQNMWLTARAAGLGLGWVTLFEPTHLAELLGIPQGVETLGWLCLGWPDERPPAPGLERQGWSQRLSVEDVTLHERWSESTAGQPADHATVSHGRPDLRAARVAARDAEDALLAVPGSLGLIGDTIIRASTMGGLSSAGTLVIAAADHPVAGLGVSAFPTETTRLVAQALAEGAGQGTAAAADAGMDLRLVDCGIDGPPISGWDLKRPHDVRGDLAEQASMSTADVDRLLAYGERLGNEIGGNGPVAIGEVGIGNTTIASAIAALVLDLPVIDVVGRGAASDTPIMQRKQQVIERALGRGEFARPTGAWSRSDVIAALAAMGGPEQALLTGVCLGVAAVEGLVVLDGMLTGTAALLAARLQPGIEQHLVAGQRSAEPGHRAVLAALGLEPLLDVRMRAGEGVGAVLATSLLRQVTRTQDRTARTTC